MTGSTLFVVATPIGNLDDFTPRARKVLEEADLIAAEDTRRTRRLLSHFGIKTRLLALHEHNEESLVGRLVGKLKDGQTVALVSDAGTPLISDPGYRLLRAAHEHGIRVSPVPGASAVVAALSVAGLPTDRFCFEGFLPSKRGARRQRLAELAGEPRTMVFFEAVHRIGDCLDELTETFGAGRHAFIGREISKLHEQCLSGTLGVLKEMLGDGRIARKGEFVLAVEGQGVVPGSRADIDISQLLREMSAVMPGSRAVDLVVSLTGRKRNEIYRLMLSQRGGAEAD